MLSIPRSKRPRQKPQVSPPTTPPSDDGTDLLTSFRDDLVEEILRRLRIKDVVRTSALAKAWRSRWVSCPDLELLFYSDDPPAAVDSVLSSYAHRPVSKFELHVGRELMGKVDGWLCNLAAMGVRSLELHFVPAHILDAIAGPIVPSSLFSCIEITYLELEFWEIPTIPSSFQGFPKLVELTLDEVSLPKKGKKILEALIAMSPLLTVLRIKFPNIKTEDNGDYDKWVIQAPKLKIIDLRGEDCGWQIEDLPLLEDANFDLDGPQLARILSGVTKVKILYLDFTDDTVLERLPSYFMELKDLSFRTVFTKSSRILAIFCVLKKAPNLEDLHITILHEDDENNEVDMDFLNSQSSVGLFSRLKYFQLSAIIGQTNEMQFIEFVLSKAAKLEKIEVSVQKDSSKSTEVISSEAG